MSDADAPSSSGRDEPPALRSPGDVVRGIRWAVEHVARQRSRRMTWLDRDFAAWPLDEPELLDTLGSWLRQPQRRLVLIAHDYAVLQRRHPRFVAWRRTWAHAIEAWTPSEGVDISLPTMLVDDGYLCLQVHDALQGRGRISLDESAVRQWADEIDALLQRCEAAFPAHPLGL